MNAFKTLAAALAHYGLPTANGPDRVGVDVGEFMLMGKNPDGSWAFKHRFSRNYLYCSPEGKLVVPCDNEPFYMGTFDA